MSAAMISAFTQKVGHASEKHIVEGVAKEERARSMPNQTENAFLKIKKKVERDRASYVCIINWVITI